MRNSKSLADVIGDYKQSPNLIFTGKGGVGKSTVAAAVAYADTVKGKNVLALDLDGSPSMLDACGCASDTMDYTNNELVNIPFGTRGKMRVAFLNTIIPPIGKKHRKEQKEYEAEVVRLSKRLLPDKIDGEPSFVPVMNLVLQALHFGVIVPPKDMAHIIQLAEIFAHQRHISTDFTPGKESMKAESVIMTDRIILDTENSNNFVQLINSLQQLSDLVTDIAGRDWKGRKAAQFLALLYENMKMYLASTVAKQPELFANASIKLTNEIMGTRTKIICVTNPGLTELRKTLRDVKRIHAEGKEVDAVVMNRWPSDHHRKLEAEKVEATLRRKLDEIGVSPTFLRAEIPGGMHIVDPENSDSQKEEIENLKRMANALGLL